MDSAVALHRFQFAFTITYHYLFPQLTMGLALLIAVLKTLGLREGGDLYNKAARFWTKIFAINFAMGVVTGIPMEFQFGTNWSRFSSASGGVMGQMLAMEGVYSFFLESSFLGLFIFGEKRLGKWAHWAAAMAIFAGSWLSGYFIVAANAWMQHPVGHVVTPAGKFELQSWTAVLSNPWLFWQYLHTMTGAVVTGAFAMAAAGAYYLLQGKYEDYGRVFVRLGVTTGFPACVLMLFPTGDGQGKMIAKYQPATLAATEGLFETRPGAPMTIMGQPDPHRKRIDNPLSIPKVLSFMTYGRWESEVKGLDAFPRDQWPDNIPLLFYAFHIMVGLGTIFIAIMTVVAVWLWRGKLFETRGLLWVLMLLAPFPYIANTAGWITAEMGRQPWLVYGLMRTADGSSAQVSSGNVMFTLIGFMGMYTLLSMLFFFLVYREIERGPSDEVTH